MNKIIMLSNMYPSQEHPSYGVFVRNFEDSLVSNNILFDKIVLLKTNSKLVKILRYLYFFVKVFLTVLIKNYSIVYIHYASITSIPVLWASRFKKMNIYTNVHGTDVEPVTKKEKKLENNTRKIINISSKVIVPSDYFKDLISDKYTFNKHNIIVYPSGGIDDTTFYPLKEKLNARNKSELLNTFTLGYVSRIENEKGWKVLLDAIVKLQKATDTSKFNVIIVGEGSEREDFELKVRKYGLTHLLEIHPFVNQKELNDIYNKMDLFIFPTSKESLGLVGIEAMACGVPVIGSKIPPLECYITPYLNGLLFKVGDSEDLAIKILEFMNLTSESREEMSNEAYTTSKLYSRKNVEKSFVEIFK